MQKHGYALLFFIFLVGFLFYPNVGIYDWDKEVLYTTYIKTSLQDNQQLPFFLWNSVQLEGYPAVDQSAFFASNPETMLFTPFLPLLLLFSPAFFLKLLVLLNALVGYAGILALSRRLNWNAGQTRIFSALFLLSPIIIQHVAIGYLPWINLYLFPWLLYFLVDENALRRGVGSGMVLAMVLLQGGLHVFVWLVFFSMFCLVLLAIGKKRGQVLWSLPLSLGTAALLALPRLYISLQSFADFSQRFFSGYSIQGFLQWALIPPFFTPASMDDIEYFIEGYIDGVPYWDGELFWGAVLLLSMLLPAFFYHTHKQGKPRPIRLAAAGAGLLLLFFSFNGFYEQVISRVAAFLSFPALEGMEKYPFRLAIPAYYALAFVVADGWVDWQGFFDKAGQTLVQGWRRCYDVVRRAGIGLSRHPRITSWLAIIFVGLCGTAAGLKNVLLGWMHEQIKLAYRGQGWSWLNRAMEHSRSIPLETYLAKIDLLYLYMLRLLAALAVLFLLVWIWGRIRIPLRKEKNTTVAHFSMAVLEALLVLPLLLAFGMWWRVALATPQDTSSVWQREAPLITTSTGEAVEGAEVRSYSPSQLIIKVDGSWVDDTLLLPGIPATDARFLQADPHDLTFVAQDDRLGLYVRQAGDLHITVNQQLVIIPAGIAFVAWGLCGWILVRKNVLSK
jgi:hypothetical protein